MGGHGLTVRQLIDVQEYWKVIVWYNADYNFFGGMVKDLKDAGFSRDFVKEVMLTLYSGSAKAATCSSTRDKVSIVIFNPHESTVDYLNSAVHEAEHIKQAMLYAYKIEDAGEPPAYTIGYLIGRMWEVLGSIVCPVCSRL